VAQEETGAVGSPPPPAPASWAANDREQHVPGQVLGTPGIGIAGFILSLLGISLVGIVLSWVGYSQARREGRPKGLCLAGIIIGFVWMGVGLVITVAFLALGAWASTTTY
jgi:hypothetical protein